MGAGKKQTIGYEYYLGMHMIVCHGPIDHLREIKVDGRVAWDTGSTGGTETFNSAAETLFGETEGGVGGTFDVEMGLDAQTPNSYLISQLGADTPAFRGVVGVVLNQCYLGNNPYLKPFSFVCERIHTRQNGIAQWYDAKAAILNPDDVSAYGIMADWIAGEGTGAWFREPIVGTVPTAGALGTAWAGFDLDKTIFIPINNVTRYYGSNTIPALPEPVILTITVYHDDSATGNTIKINGVEYILTNDSYFYSHYDFTVPASESPSTLTVEYFVIQGFPGGTDIDFGGGIAISLNPPVEQPCSDMNPAHIIREALTDPDWGMGYAEADIDDTAFTAAADTLYNESMGISLLWDRQMPLEDFISEILRHIDGVLYVDRVSGKFVLKLIRDDYAMSALVVLDESNISEVKNARRPTVGELTNSITISYYDHDNQSGIGSTGLQDQALIQVQGAVIGTNIQYTGFTKHNTASRVAERDLRALSTPLLAAEITASRDAAGFNVGDAFLLSWPDLEINGVVMRVQSISLGDNRSNTVKLSALEDVFSLSAPGQTLTGKPSTGLWIDPTTQPALEASPRIIMETPYYEAVRSEGQAAVDAVLVNDPDAGFVAATAGRQSNELNADLYVDSGAGYVKSGILDFSAYATLNVDAWYSDANLYYTGGTDLGSVVAGDLAQIDDEIIRFDAWGTDSNGTYMTVGRGVLDTTPREHTASASIVFFDLASDEVQYTASDSIDVFLRTKLGSSVSSAEPVDTVVMDSRAIRPYAPGDIRIDGFSYPADYVFDLTNTISWKHRDRTQQTSGTVFDYTATDIGPEAGTEYIVRIDSILSNGNISSDWVDENVGSATSFSFDSNTDSNTGQLPDQSDFVRVKVYSKRGGYESWQPAMLVASVGVDSNYTPNDHTIITLSSGGEFDFSSIQGGFSRLILEGNVRSTAAGSFAELYLFFNEETTAANYIYQTKYASNGSAAQDDGAVPRIAYVPAASSPAGAYGTFRIIIEGYENTAYIKTAHGRYASWFAAGNMSTGSNSIACPSMTSAINRLRLRSTTSTTALVGTVTLTWEN